MWNRHREPLRGRELVHSGTFCWCLAERRKSTRRYPCPPYKTSVALIHYTKPSKMWTFHLLFMQLGQVPCVDLLASVWDCRREVTVVVAGGAALMHHNCLPEDKMSNRCLSGWRGPSSHLFFVLLFYLPSYSSLMECGQHTNLSTPQQTSCSVDERQMRYSWCS